MKKSNQDNQILRKKTITDNNKIKNKNTTTFFIYTLKIFLKKCTNHQNKKETLTIIKKNKDKE